MSKNSDENERRTLAVDDCFSDIGIEQLADLCSFAHGKLNLKCTDVYLKQVDDQLKNDE